MGKKLIIKGANFAENAIAQDGTWQTILDGSYTFETGNTIKIPLESVIPTGSLTRLTRSVVDVFSAAFGATDTQGVAYDDYWGRSIYPSSGTVVSEMELTFDMAKFSIWTLEAGGTVTYKLEVYTLDN